MAAWQSDFHKRLSGWAAVVVVASDPVLTTLTAVVTPRMHHSDASEQCKWQAVVEVDVLERVA